MNGFSIIYKSTTRDTDNTLVTLLGKPNWNGESWQDNLIRLIMSKLLGNIPNAMKPTFINNESPIIDKLHFMGIVSVDQEGSLQSARQLASTNSLKRHAESLNISETDAIIQVLNQNLFPYANAEPFLYNAIERLRQETQDLPIFNFSDKQTAPLISYLQDIADESIHFAMNASRHHNFVFYKNAIIADTQDPAFLSTDYNNLILIDTSHTDDEYLANWKFLDPSEFETRGFGVIASNTDFQRYAQATQQGLSDFVDSNLITKTLEVITGGM